MDKQVWILRGLPGSGKSTFCQQLQEDSQLSSVRCNTDHYFEVNGQYQFDVDRLGEFHQRNLYRFISAVSNQVPLVICDNTNMQIWEFANYVKVASEYDYQVKIKTIGDPNCRQHQKECANRNSHGVLLSQIRLMGQRYQPWQGLAVFDAESHRFN